MFEIEKNVPVGGKRGRTAIYPFRKMEIGDSFKVPCEASERPAAQRRLCSAARQVLGNQCFRTAQESDGVRLWRTA